MSYRIPKLGDDGKIAPEHVPDPESIGAQPAGDYATATDLSTGLAGKVNTSTYTAGLAAKQDKTALDSDVAGIVSDPGSAGGAALRAALGHPVSTDGTNDLPAPTGEGLEFVITASGLDDIRYNGVSL